MRNLFLGLGVEINEGECAIVEWRGRFSGVLQPGRYYLSPLERVAGTLDMRTSRRGPLKVRVKTSDFHVEDIDFSYMWKVNPDMLREAFYRCPKSAADSPVRSVFGVWTSVKVSIQSPSSFLDATLTNVAQDVINSLAFQDLYKQRLNAEETIRGSFEGQVQEYGYLIPRVFLTPPVPERLAGKAMEWEFDLRTADKRNEANRVLRVGDAMAEMEALLVRGAGDAGSMRQILSAILDAAEGLKMRGWGPENARLSWFIYLLTSMLRGAEAPNMRVVLTPDIAEAFAGIKDLFRKGGEKK